MLCMYLKKRVKLTSLDGALDVTDDGTAGILDEFDTNLCDTTARTGTANDLGNSDELKVFLL